VRGREHISAVILYNFREPRNIFRLKSAGHETFLCCPGSNRPDAYENTGEVEMVRILRTAMPLLVLLAQPAIADDRIYPLIKYDCDTKADILTITNSLLKAEENASFNYSAEDGTYSPWDMVEIDRKPNRTLIIRTSKIERECMLSSGTYRAVIEPQIFSHDLSGSCSENISGAVTIEHDSEEFLSRTPFEDFCLGNSPIIIRISVFGKTGEYQIKRIPKYNFY
jgi:hypothetical protein